MNNPKPAFAGFFVFIFCLKMMLSMQNMNKSSPKIKPMVLVIGNTIRSVEFVFPLFIGL
jgi:hypothetical protein